MGIGGDSQSLLEREPTQSKDRGLLSYNIDNVFIMTSKSSSGTSMYIVKVEPHNHIFTKAYITIKIISLHFWLAKYFSVCISTILGNGYFSTGHFNCVTNTNLKKSNLHKSEG